MKRGPTLIRATATLPAVYRTYTRHDMLSQFWYATGNKAFDVRDLNEEFPASAKDLNAGTLAAHEAVIREARKRKIGPFKETA